MKTIDPMLFTDVEDALTIGNPVIVEKDYYAVLLVKNLYRYFVELLRVVEILHKLMTKP